MINFNSPHEYKTFRNICDQLHREDGPAFINQKENQWINKGQLHRVNAPAVISKCKKVYSIRNICNRIDGPAYKFNKYVVEFYPLKQQLKYKINGHFHSFNRSIPAFYDFDQDTFTTIKEYYLYEKLFLKEKLRWGIDDYEKYLNGVLHDDHSYAVKEYATFSYYINGKLHRIDGPAVENQ